MLFVGDDWVQDHHDIEYTASLFRRACPPRLPRHRTLAVRDDANGQATAKEQRGSALKPMFTGVRILEKWRSSPRGTR